MNQMKTRLQSLGLLDRALRAMSDEELTDAAAALDDDHREALERVVGGELAPDAVRARAARGRIDGTLESIALVLTDATLADCIKELGEHSDNPTSDQLRGVLPGVIERRGLGLTRLMLASTLAGEAAASAVLRDLLKHDETVKLPPFEHPGPLARPQDSADDDVKARRREAKQRKQADARVRREQAARARRRV